MRSREEDSSSEPPSDSQIDAVYRSDHGTRVPVEYIVELDRDIGIGLVSDAAYPGRAVELAQGHVTVRHALLRVVLLIAAEEDQVMTNAARKNMQCGLEIVTPHL